MAEHPIVMENKQQVKILVKQPGQNVRHETKKSVVESGVEVSEPKKTVAQRLSAYAFGEEIQEPGKYIFKSYLEPTGKRVANDVVEHFLTMIKHTFQRWIWGINAKLPDDGKYYDRTSFSNSSRQPQQIKAMVTLSPVKELTFETYEDAERVLNELKYTAQEENGVVTVRQYYEASGQPGLVESNGVSSSSGWKLDMLKRIEKPLPQADKNGFYIPLPKPISLSASSN